MRATDFSVVSDGVELAATLTLPDAQGNPPLVVCLHGTFNYFCRLHQQMTASVIIHE